MNRFALLSLYRSLTRHRLYAALNIGGLAVGIAVFLVLGLYVRFETSYETWLPDHDQIYRVRSEWNIPGSPFDGVTPQTAGGLLDMMKEDFPRLKGTRISHGGKVVQGNANVDESIAQVDPEFLDVFRLEVVRGDARGALSRPTDLLLTETAAQKYFGSSDPIGRTLTLSNGDERTAYRVAAVLRDLPKNTELDLAILIPLKAQPPGDESLWRHLGALSVTTYLHFDTPEAARAFERQMPAFVTRHAGGNLGENPTDTLSYPLTPIADLHLGSVGQGHDSTRLTVVTLGIVGVLTLLIAVVNYINLATARAGLRAREVAMRKVVGADRRALVLQFLGEAMLMVALAALGGLILAELSLPLVNAAGGLSLEIPYALAIPALALAVVVVGVVAGFYPAILLSRFPAAGVLASSRSPGGGRAGTRMREALVVFQFALAIAFIIGTSVLFAQMHHVRSNNIGFDREGLIVIPALADSSLTEGARASLLAAFREMPTVTAITTGTMAAGGSNSHSAENVPLPGVRGEGPTLRLIHVGPDFFQTYGMPPVAGRLFDPAFGADDSTETETEGNFNIIINRRAASALGFSSPEAAIGKTVGGQRPRTIVGVVEDARFMSPRVAIDPTMYVYKGRMPSWPMATLRYEGDPREVMEAVQATWRRMAPEVPFNGAHADQRLERLYRDDDRAARLFGIGASLAVLIGCVGLWGLASFNTARRTKEVGIRKTLGASSTDIVKLLVGQFLRPVLVANLIAWPLAFIAMRTWLAGFDERIALSPLFFLGASAGAILIAILTVLGQSLRASRAAPSWALRHD